MAAKLSRPQREKIRAMHEDGARQKEIADALGVARCTVARYVQDIEAEVELQRSPAAGLSHVEVRRLQFLARTVHELGCPQCSEVFIASVAANDGTCPHCGVAWQRHRPSRP